MGGRAYHHAGVMQGSCRGHDDMPVYGLFLLGTKRVSLPPADSLVIDLLREALVMALKGLPPDDAIPKGDEQAA